jgi:hypothetical protein
LRKALYIVDEWFFYDSAPVFSPTRCEFLRPAVCFQGCH